MERRRTFRSTLTGDLVEDASKLVAEANGSPVAPVVAAPTSRAKAKSK